MIESIGAWVLEESCKQAKAWLDAAIGPLRIAVNLSARQFRQAELLEHIPTLLAKTGLTPQYLELEITESMMMQDLERSEQILAQLNGMGITLSVDDFGTGYTRHSVNHFVRAHQQGFRNCKSEPSRSL